MLSGLADNPDTAKVNLVFCADGFASGDLFLRELKSGKNRLAGCVTWAPKTTEVAEKSDGRAHVLTTNANLMIIADILIVNKGFAKSHPAYVKGLVEGLLEGNSMIREDADKIPRYDRQGVQMGSGGSHRPSSPKCIWQIILREPGLLQRHDRLGRKLWIHLRDGVLRVR